MNTPCLLAFDAATQRLCVAASHAGRVALRELEPARDHTPLVYRLAVEVLTEVGTNIAGLDAVAFGCGPGSFTGVRVAAAAAQSIAYARRIPVCRVSSLRLLAASAGPAAGDEPVAVCMDARMGRVYAALFENGATGAASETWSDPATLAWPGESRFRAVGDGWTAWPDLLQRYANRMSGHDAALLPSAQVLLDLAIAEYRAGRHVTAAEALPEYLGQMPARPAGVAASIAMPQGSLPQ